MIETDSRLKKSLLCTLFFLLLSSAVLLPLGAVSAQELIERGELVAAFDLNGEPLSFNPHQSTNSTNAQLFTAITEGLVTYNPLSLSPVLGVASSIRFSDDDLTITISVRTNARFSNGDKITAKTFRDSWLYLIDPETAGDQANLLDMIEGVREYRTGILEDPNKVGISLVDLYTLQIKLTAPSPYILNILAHHAFAPIHPANLGSSLPLEAGTFVSSGAFRVVETDEQGGLLLEKNPYYWDASSVELEHIRIQLRGTSVDLLSDFSSGLVHWSQAYLPVSMLVDPNDLTAFPEYSTSFFYFCADAGPYADLDVRKALSLLVSWDEIREVSASVYKTDTLIPQDIGYHGNTGISKQNRALAMELLAQAGYPEGEGLPPMEIAIYPNAKLEQMTDIITDVWSQELGMTIIIDVVPFSVYIDDPEHSPYSMAYLTWVGDFYDPYSFLSLWSSDSTFNPGRFDSPSYDALIEKALRQRTTEERYRLFKEAEKMLLDSASVIPISHGVSVNFIDTDVVSGWYPNLLNIHPFKFMKLVPATGSSRSSL